MNDLITINDLTVRFAVEGQFFTAVDSVALSIPNAKTVGLIGESGCGKSVTALSILRLIPNPPGEISKGQIIFGEDDLLKCSIEKLHKIRGREISMIFQEPMTSLNPVYTVGKQIKEVYDLHFDFSNEEKLERAVRMLDLVGIPDPLRHLKAYPHELSGGMRQRVMIAMALACSPKLLIADEPTTALDVTIQAQVLDLINRIKDEFNMSVLFITHDLGIVAQMCDYVNVMYAGRIVEKAGVIDLYKHPMHPYTKGLLTSLPKRGLKRGVRLPTIPGIVSDIDKLPKGCRFADRCFKAQAKCRLEDPLLESVEGNREVACFYPLQD
ncbi:MAG: ABC transporter ATP-binding protein [Pseudomonadota bacterium]